MNIKILSLWNIRSKLEIDNHIWVDVEYCVDKTRHPKQPIKYLTTGMLHITNFSWGYGLAQIIFQTDALSSLSDRRESALFDWLRAPSLKHQFENQFQDHNLESKILIVICLKNLGSKSCPLIGNWSDDFFLISGDFWFGFISFSFSKSFNKSMRYDIKYFFLGW